MRFENHGIAPGSLTSISPRNSQLKSHLLRKIELLEGSSVLLIAGGLHWKENKKESGEKEITPVRDYIGATENGQLTMRGPYATGRLPANDLATGTSSPGLLSSGDLESPLAGLSFSPDANYLQESRRLLLVLDEFMSTEVEFAESLHLLCNFLLEPLLVKSANMEVTCSPLVNVHDMARRMFRDRQRAIRNLNRELSVSACIQAANSHSTSCDWGPYSCCIDQLLHMLADRVPPFELSFVQSLQDFLEANQPTKKQRDLSFYLLLQKPIGRITKYQLFFSSVSRIVNDMESAQALENIKTKILGINSQIGAWKDRTKNVCSNVDFSPAFAKLVHFYGNLIRSTDMRVGWMEVGRRSSLTFCSKLCRVLLFEKHAVFTCKRDKPYPLTLLFVIPFPQCWLVKEPASVGGLYCETPAMKILFQKEHCTYELLLKGQAPQLEEIAMALPTEELLYQGKSNTDCFVGPALAPCDVSLQHSHFSRASATCYFKRLRKVATEF